MNPLQKRLIAEGIKAAVKNPRLASTLLKPLRARIKKGIMGAQPTNLPYLTEIKTQFLVNLFEQSAKSIQKGYFSPEYAERVRETLVMDGFLSERRPKVRKEYEDKYGIEPPSFCLISPTQRCNLKCTGCYAASESTTPATLNYEVFTRLLHEMRDLIGSNFIVISGGEPFIYNSQGKTLLDAVEEFSDMFFLVYTNGMALTEETVERMAKLGNITTAISVEGYEKETDARRGKGVYAKIMDSMERLRHHGVPFGTSVTATKNNVEILLTDEFYKHHFEELGAVYMWMFHLMPIGRAKDTMDLMISPEQRVALYNQWERMLFDKKYFVGDFWNSGAAAYGCIAYARAGGYFYVDWNGNIMPCGFVPYYKDNLYDLYREGKTIADALMSDLFVRGRKWQHEYAYHQAQPHNLLAPCSIRDHHKNFRENILDNSAKPEDENAKAALEDPEYYKRLVEFDEELEKLTQPIWQERYLKGLKRTSR
ncbi:radical SAM protein [candidate division TA06 bacterium B3_TA06]|uniref:Radical SAM protein n=1 Tax=candidate division TA06 bacterium B3_TA06 TaxID=2012487 RepID=A0A532V516_UNCT6|nr:MAG: radical SAM protein [candidate division TA06 bacterium B3_TA06]